MKAAAVNVAAFLIRFYIFSIIRLTVPLKLQVH